MHDARVRTRAVASLAGVTEDMKLDVTFYASTTRVASWYTNTPQRFQMLTPLAPP